MTKQTWHLRNAEADNEKWPKTFKIPLREVRYGLVVGQIVKLIFELNKFGAGCERMWVEVSKVESGSSGGQIKRWYTGLLRNTPASEKFKLAWDDEVEFGPEHVCSIEEPDSGASNLPSGGESNRVN